MSPENCPKCNGTIQPLSMTLCWFPFFLRCSHCNVKLKLKSYRVLALTAVAYIALMIVSIMLVPFVRSYGLGILLGVFGWYVVYYYAARYMLNKDNLQLLE
ncbi:hypothetical protein [Flocculibacter collagenilyticus]|uniref:hypothetical protein n=1 Tax=Flocculibacter collagenilyticus TaxID=2744479 RepID=UPI0018F623FE|nr:hypothetical protein [Flocculibacter collagenilyticus]